MAQYLTTRQVSEMTGIPTETLRWFRHVGRGPKSFKLSPRAVRYALEDVEAWIQAAREATVAA